METIKCELCPRECRVDRNTTKGFCGQSSQVKIARYQKHMWEEPCISGSGGSGTVFFSGCTLKCVFCQNYEVSRGMGKEITIDRLADIILELQDMGCHNVSMVTGSHFVPQIKRALDMVKHRLTVPVVFNCGGYEKVETIKSLEGYVDIWLPDLKYRSDELAARYSSCSGYYDNAIAAIGEMLRQAGGLHFDGEIMKKGVIVRHLVLPGYHKDSISLLEGLHENYGSDDLLLSLMSQYTPMPSCADYPEINRKITKLEYRRVSEKAVQLGFDGYFQEASSSGDIYIPPFAEGQKI